MSKRDLNIINDLERFRVMSRDDIIDLYFSQLKHPINNANTVLKRLVRDKRIAVSKNFSPYVYFPAESHIKKNSTKIPHFLKIVEAYKQLKQFTDPQIFEVEPKYRKGLAEPDILTTINNIPFFIEIQRTQYSQKVMDNKIKKYESLYYEMDKMPYIIMVSDIEYQINSDIIKVFQVKSINEFMSNVFETNKATNKSKKIKVKVG